MVYLLPMYINTALTDSEKIFFAWYSANLFHFFQLFPMHFQLFSIFTSLTANCE